MMAKHQYPINSCRLIERSTLEKVALALKEQKVQEPEDEDQSIVPREAVPEVTAQEPKKGKGKGEKVVKEKKVKAPWGKKEDSGRTLKSVLADCLGYGPALCEHIILDSGLQSGTKVTVGSDGVVSTTKAELEALMAAVKRFEDWLDSVVNGSFVPEGYIYMQKKKIAKGKTSVVERQEQEEKVGMQEANLLLLSSGVALDHSFIGSQNLFQEKEGVGPVNIPVSKLCSDEDACELVVQIYDEFAPLPMKQFDDRTAMKMDTFDLAMDEFFSKIEGQRAEQQRKAQEDSAFSKLDKIRADQVILCSTLECNLFLYNISKPRFHPVF